MSLMEELCKAYESKEHALAVERAAQEFFKPLLLEAASRQEDRVFVEVAKMPKILRESMEKVRQYLESEKLIVKYGPAGMYLVVSGWAPEKSPPEKGLDRSVETYLRWWGVMF